MKRYRQHWRWKLALGSCLVMGSAIGEGVLQTFALPFNCAFAEITPDSTLPNNSRVTTQENIRTIEGGTQAGSNLFHSFGEFSVPAGGTAVFNNAADIQNIISRVTGGSASNIDGIIRANGTANLFLINPNGIVFGQNAQLNIGGSFVATTANALQFGNIGFFSATDKNIPSPLLTINPSALLFNQINQNAAIQNNSVAPAGTDPAGFDALGLRVPDGKSLLLVGGNVSMDGGQLNANGGRVELGGLGEPGTVTLGVDRDNLSLIFPENVTRADISFTNRAGVFVEAAGGGSITVNARNIDILETSVLSAGIGRGLGSVDTVAGDITLNAIGEIKAIKSYIVNNVPLRAIGNGGNVTIFSDSLSLTDGAQLQTNTSGQGDAGSMNINARNTVYFNRGVAISNVLKGAVGKSGNINITTGSLSLINGGQLSSSTFGQGKAGSITITARDTVSLQGWSNDGYQSAIFSGVELEGLGKGGDINIMAESIYFTDRAQLSSGTRGRGNAGNVNINARDTVSFEESAVLSTVDGGAVGKGGDINIITGSLLGTNGTELNASTSGQGDGGSVTIQATNFVSFDKESTIFSSVNAGAIGKGGGIDILTGSLSVTNGAELVASTTGQGDAGSVTITARDTVSFDGEGREFSSAVFSTVDAGAVGNGGDIRITTGSLSVTNGGELIATTFGQGNAGSIKIQARDAVSFDGARSNGLFFSGAYSAAASIDMGNGGDIKITTRSLSVSNGALLSASTLGQGNGGNVILDVNTLEAVNNGEVRTTSASSGKAGNITLNATDSVNLAGSSGLFANTSKTSTAQGGDLKITTRQLVVRDDAEVTVGSQGSGRGGNLEVAAHSIWLDNQAKLTAETTSGKGGNITLQNLDLLLLRRNSQISTTAGTEQLSGDGGNITINVPNGFIVAVPSENSDITANAYTGSGGRVDIQAFGIYGIQPRQFPTSLSDITASSQFGINGTVELNTPDIDPNSGLVNLPAVPVDTQVAQTCTAGSAVAQSSFTITGRGGLPPNPGEALSADAVQVDLVTLNPEVGKPSTSAVSTNPTSQVPSRIVEATGWVTAANGDIILTSSAPITPHSSWQRTADCRAFNQRQGG
ncbi:filamentous hemagglutinin N-terminal domain-containing protein [Nostoc sp. CCCryo 231-06]|nr:filamentous hemagglutinin N-terminal domain-containing protein [Nostoc sp. CCCryo 231-06]